MYAINVSITGTNQLAAAFEAASLEIQAFMDNAVRAVTAGSAEMDAALGGVARAGVAAGEEGALGIQKMGTTMSTTAAQIEGNAGAITEAIARIGLSSTDTSIQIKEIGTAMSTTAAQVEGNAGAMTAAIERIGLAATTTAMETRAMGSAMTTMGMNAGVASAMAANQNSTMMALGNTYQGATSNAKAYGNEARSGGAAASEGAKSGAAAVNGMAGSFNTLKMAAGAAFTFAGMMMATFLTQAVATTAELQKQFYSLGAAYGMNVGQSIQAIPQLEESSLRMVRETGYAVDQLTPAMAQLSLFVGQSQTAIEHALPYVTGIANLKGLDPQAAAAVYGKALEGSPMAMKQLGINIGTDLPEGYDAMNTAERQKYLDAALRERGVLEQNAAVANSAAGKYALFTTMLQYLEYEIGAALLPSLVGLMEVLMPLVGAMQKYPLFGEIVAGILLVGTALTLMAGPLLALEGLAALPAMFSGLANAMRSLPGPLADLFAGFGKTAAAADTAATSSTASAAAQERQAIATDTSVTSSTASAAAQERQSATNSQLAFTSNASTLSQEELAIAEAEGTVAAEADAAAQTELAAAETRGAATAGGLSGILAGGGIAAGATAIAITVAGGIAGGLVAGAVNDAMVTQYRGALQTVPEEQRGGVSNVFNQVYPTTTVVEKEINTYKPDGQPGALFNLGGAAQWYNQLSGNLGSWWDNNINPQKIGGGGGAIGESGPPKGIGSGFTLGALQPLSDIAHLQVPLAPGASYGSIMDTLKPAMDAGGAVTGWLGSLWSGNTPIDNALKNLPKGSGLSGLGPAGMLADLLLPKGAAATDGTGGSGKKGLPALLSGDFKGAFGDFKMPELKFPNVGEIGKWIQDRLPKLPEIKWPSIGEIGKWIQDRLPKLSSIKFPSLAEIGKWIQDRIPRLNWKIPSVGDIINAVQKFIGSLNWNIPSIPDIIASVEKFITDLIWQIPSAPQIVSDAVAHFIDWLHWPSISWDDVMGAIRSKIPAFPWPSGPAGVVTGWVHDATDKIRKTLHMGPSVSTAMGPSGTFANVADSLITGKSYMGYGGSQRSLNEVHAAGGNCVDLSLMLLDAAGQMGIPGHLGLTTWNGNSHAFANIGGQIYDPAHKILSGNWGLPPQGPGGCADGEHHIKVELNINGPVYDANDIINNAKPLLHQLANEVFSKRSRRDYVTGDY